MSEEVVTKEKIDELPAFLPGFDTPQQGEFIERWGGGQPTDSGAVTMPIPVYSAEVAHFFQLAGQSCWADYNYIPAEAARMI